MRAATGLLAWVFLVTVPLAGAVAQDNGGKEGKGTPATVIPVWPKDAPGSEKWTQKEIESPSAWDHKKIVRNVVRPTLTAFLPERPKANGTAVIVCPGGGFRFLAWESEGTEVAEWLRARGVAAFVLKYRLLDTGATEEELRKSMQELFSPRSVLTALARQQAIQSGKSPDLPEGMRQIAALAAADGWQAVKLLRERAAEWGVKPDRIGIMGFSAGGLVTAAVAKEYDAGSRPNFAAPIYGLWSGGKVPADAPPLFVLCAGDDALVPPAESIRLYSDWKAAGKSAELHIYAKGGHGFGMRKQGLPSDGWIDRFGDWLGQQGLLGPTKAAK
jgi:acetyl esterase/lipase